MRTYIILFLSIVLLLSGCQFNAVQPNNDSNPSPKNQQQMNKKDIAGVKLNQTDSETYNQHKHSEKEKEKENRNKQSKYSNEVVGNKRNNVKVKGIYVPPTAATLESIKPLTNLIANTELNAMVIDVKTDTGHLTYKPKDPLIKQFHTGENKKHDLQKLINQLKESNIYAIARIVTFKDPYLAGLKTEWSMRTHSGALWKDDQGIAWVDPYQTKIWDYNIAIAKEAAALGFDEIQFDYVRFPDNGKKLDREVTFHNPKDWSKAEVIEQFLKQAKESLGHDIFISADVFGLTTSTADDMGIGQQWGKIVKHTDYISPMVYPSHYSSGMYGIDHPDLEPYKLIQQSMKDALSKNNSIEQQGFEAAEIRPWLQSFTANWVRPHQDYGNEQIKQQIKAARQLGIDQYLLWNPLGNYEMK
jgi:hypothetical protein